MAAAVVAVVVCHQYRQLVLMDFVEVQDPLVTAYLRYTGQRSSCGLASNAHSRNDALIQHVFDSNSRYLLGTAARKGE